MRGGKMGLPVLHPRQLARLVGVPVELEEGELGLGADGVEDGLEGGEELVHVLRGDVDGDLEADAVRGGHCGVLGMGTSGEVPAMRSDTTEFG